MTDAASDRSLRRRAAGWLGEHVAVPIVVGVIVTLVTVFFLSPLGGSSGGQHPPAPALSTQWLHVHAAIARHGWKIAEKRMADLRGNGEPSTILVLSPPAKSCLSKTPVHAQQVRIYDVEEGRLDRQLTFQPRTLGCPPWEFKFMKIAPLLEYGDSPVILGKFVGGDDPFSDEISVPVEIAWNDGTGRYSLRPLLLRPPSFVRFGYRKPLTGTDRSWYAAARKVFGQAVDLGAGLRGFAVEEVALGYSPEWRGPILAGVYRITAGNAGTRTMVPTPIVFQQAIWHLGTTPSGDLYAGECHLLARRATEFGEMEEWPSVTRLAAHADSLISGCDEY